MNPTYYVNRQEGESRKQAWTSKKPSALKTLELRVMLVHLCTTGTITVISQTNHVPTSVLSALHD